MRDDVETPFLEIGDLVLRFADDNLDDGLIQPGGLRLQLLRFLLERGTDERFGGVRLEKIAFVWCCFDIRAGTSVMRR